MTYLLFFLLVLVTNVIQGITGFAGTVLAMPFAILLFGIDTAKPILTVLTTLACMIVVCKSWHSIVWREFSRMFGLMFAGVFLGEYIYRVFPLEILLPIYATFIILIALKGLLLKRALALPESCLTLIVLGAGIIHGMFISGGPLLILYAVKKIPDKEQFRATLSLIWISLNIYLITKQLYGGLFPPATLHILLLSTPALVAGVILGNTLAKKMSQEVFLRLTYVLLLISGASLFL